MRIASRPSLHEEPAETKDVKVLFVFAHSPGFFHTNKPIEKMEDLKGLRIRSTGTSAKIAEALGAVPVAMPQSQTYEALQKAGLNGIEQLKYIIGTGYGRMKIPFANDNISEITCHGVGAHWLCPSVKTIIDIGGQDCKVISLNNEGRVIDFVMNDKCAAGTGRFLEAMARVLSLSLAELSTASLDARSPASITSQCSVFSESEVITLLNEGRDVPDVVAGIHQAIANRLLALVKKVGQQPDVTVAGGCAKNTGLIKILEEKLNMPVVTMPQDPQITGALGAAVLASEKAG